MEQTVPKFKIGQIVVAKNMKQQRPFRILGTTWGEGEWFYQWNRNNYAAEHMLRELTLEEIGAAQPGDAPQKEKP